MPSDRELRFWAKVRIGGEQDCWPWTGAKRGSRQARGCFWDGARNVDAARWLWQHSFERLLGAGEVVMHTCDTPLCVNPRHLFVGTQADNVADMHAKGRSHHQTDPAVQAKAIAAANATMRRFPHLRARGERHGLSRLSDRQRAVIAESQETTAVLAQRYGVHRTRIQRIRAAALRARATLSREQST